MPKRMIFLVVFLLLTCLAGVAAAGPFPVGPTPGATMKSVQVK